MATSLGKLGIPVIMLTALGRDAPGDKLYALLKGGAWWRAHMGTRQGVDGTAQCRVRTTARWRARAGVAVGLGKRDVAQRGAAPLWRPVTPRAWPP